MCVQVDRELASGEFFLQETEKKRMKLQEVKVRPCFHSQRLELHEDFCLCWALRLDTTVQIHNLWVTVTTPSISDPYLMAHIPVYTSPS